MRRSRLGCLYILLALSLALLSACSPSGEQALRAYIDQERAAQHPFAKPLVVAKPFEAAAYDEVAKPDPFNRQNFAKFLLISLENGKPTLATPEIARPKQPLEAFALESISLVGVMSKPGGAVALVRVSGALHVIRVGDYIGQQFGKVTKVDASGITLREIVQDDLGEWSVRTTVLKLQERSP